MDESISTILAAPIPFQNSKEERLCKTMIASLSEQQIEQAANTSFAYFSASPKVLSNKIEIRERMALRMARRHLVAKKGNSKLATYNMKQTLDFREHTQLNKIRQQYCTSHDDIFDHPVVQSIAVNGYDVHGHAILVRCPMTFNSPSDETFVKLVCYQLERAIACTERKSLGKEEKIIVAVDYTKCEKNNVPPFYLLRKIISLFQCHYPERLYMCIAMDPPTRLLLVKKIIWPFVNLVIKEKVKFLYEKEKEKEFGNLIPQEQAMPFLRINGKNIQWNIKEYLYSIPFNYAANEKINDN